MAPDLLRISEMFYSIQGESTRTGLPCAFIRLAGCNLRCTYCDSRYTWDELGTMKSIGEIIKWLDRYPDVMVEITGGEPLLHQEVYPLMKQLVTDRRLVLLETSGSLDISNVPKGVGIILDLKCPGSGMSDKNKWSNLDIIKKRIDRGPQDEIKFVISDEEDFFWAVHTVRKHRLTEHVPVLFSPVTDRLDPAKLADLILQERLGVRLQLQLHTQIWPGVKRGV